MKDYPGRKPSDKGSLAGSRLWKRSSLAGQRQGLLWLQNEAEGAHQGESTGDPEAWSALPVAVRLDLLLSWC